MSLTETLRLGRGGWSLRHPPRAIAELEVGDVVQVRRIRAPLSGKTGRLLQIVNGDPYGPYLVQFDDGFRFRYQRHELSPL